MERETQVFMYGSLQKAYLSQKNLPLRLRQYPIFADWKDSALGSLSVLISKFDNVFYVKKRYHRKDAKAAKIHSEQCTFSGGEKPHTASPSASFSIG